MLGKAFYYIIFPNGVKANDWYIVVVSIESKVILYSTFPNKFPRAKK